MQECKRKNRDFYNLLFNVNQINVTPNCINEYIKFSHELNHYLSCKYPEYYAGLQLYQSNTNRCCFTVIAAYYDVPNVYEKSKMIGDEISTIYDCVWGCKVKRSSIFTFRDNCRIS